MPRLNLYEQQTSAQGPRASGADFGAAPAQALEGAGNALYDIGERIQRRDELLAADQVMTDVDTWALTALDDFSKRQDITSQQSLPEFQNALKQKRAEALSKFSGRPEARAALERQLDNQLAQYGKSAGPRSTVDALPPRTAMIALTALMPGRSSGGWTSSPMSTRSRSTSPSSARSPRGFPIGPESDQVGSPGASLCASHAQMKRA